MTDNDKAEQIALIQEAVRPLLMELIRAWRTPEKPVQRVMQEALRRAERVVLPEGVFCMWCGKKLTEKTDGCSCRSGVPAAPATVTREAPKDISAVWTRNADGSVTATFPKLIDECPEEGADPRCKWKSASGSERVCRYLVSTDQEKHTIRCGYPSVHMDGVTETDIERDGMI